MGEVRYVETADIAVAPDVVFDYRLDFATLPAYNPSVSNMRRTDGGTTPGVGAEYRFDLTIPGMGAMETPLRVVEAARPERIVFDTGPGFIARETCTFSPFAGGTRVVFDTTVTIEGELDDATRATIEASGREQARAELELLKKVLEG